jgi:hypothetical protein
MGYPEYPNSVCTSCWYGGYFSVPDPVVGCRACGRYDNDMTIPLNASGTEIPYVSSIPTQKIIQKVVRVDGSDYTMNKGALNVFTKPVATYNNVNWNQQSDRAIPGIVHRNVPSRGNSTRTSITRMRPGSMSAPSSSIPGSKGVDMKHGSYDRYLAKLKGAKALRTESHASTHNVVPVQGNKSRMFGVAYSNNCQYPFVCVP